MADPSTQALIDEAYAHTRHRSGGSYAIIDRLAAELARLSTPTSDARSDGIKRHLPSADWLRRRIETDPDLDCEAGRPLEAAGAVGETVPTISRIICDDEHAAGLGHPECLMKYHADRGLCVPANCRHARTAQKIIALISPRHPASEGS